MVESLKTVLDKGAYAPERAHKEDAGYDLRSPVHILIKANDYATIDTGIHCSIPFGFVGFLKSKSSLNVKHDIVGEGVIDCGYTGSICVKLYNHGTTDYEVNVGDKIIQMVILPILTPDIEIVESLEETERGVGGFGSTGK